MTEEAWSYLSELSVSISGDLTEKYWAGQKIKIVQEDGTKFFKIDKVEYEDPNTVLTLDGLGIYILEDSEILDHKYSSQGAPKGFPSYGRILKLGSNIYEANYYYPDSSYLVMDRETYDDDCSVVFRTQGSARAEFGLIGDEDYHFKTVTGEYPNETFVDRLLVRASGAVDAFGSLLRAYGTSGVHSVIAGNSDRETGAGLEMTYDQTNTQAWITSVEHGNCYRNLNIAGQNILFSTGAVTLTQILSLGSDGNAYFAGDVSALSFTDRTDAFIGDALAIIKQIKSDTSGHIDHSSLPEFALSAYQDEKGEWWPGRNIGNMVSILVAAVNQLSEEIDNKNKVISDISNKLDKLEAKLNKLIAQR